MANISNTKNILLIGKLNQGKTTLKNALKTVLSERYGLGEEMRESDVKKRKYYDSDMVFSYTIDGCCYRIIDIPTNKNIEQYLEKCKSDIDAVVWVCSIANGANYEDEAQIACCKKVGIKVACVYVSGVTADTSYQSVEAMDEKIYRSIGNQGHPNTIKLTEELNTKALTYGELTISKKCYVLHSDSKKAIEDPFGEHADVLVRLIHSLKVAIWGV